MTGIPTAAVVLLALFVAGVLAGRAKQRWVLLLAGLAALVVVGALATGVTRPAVPAPEWTRLLTTAVPLLVTFLAGWLCARGSWLTRIVVVAAAALVLAALPYAALGAALARTF